MELKVQGVGTAVTDHGHPGSSVSQRDPREPLRGCGRGGCRAPGSRKKFPLLEVGWDKVFQAEALGPLRVQAAPCHGTGGWRGETVRKAATAPCSCWMCTVSLPEVGIPSCPPCPLQGSGKREVAKESFLRSRLRSPAMQQRLQRSHAPGLQCPRSGCLERHGCLMPLSCPESGGGRVEHGGQPQQGSSWRSLARNSVRCSQRAGHFPS